jgi:hypothetical protein
MKCIAKDKVIKRVSDESAVMLVNQGWYLCPKSEWKKNVRDVKKAAKTPEVVEAEKNETDELNKKKNPKKGGGKSKKVKKETSGGSNTPESHDAPPAPSKG